MLPAAVLQQLAAGQAIQPDALARAALRDGIRLDAALDALAAAGLALVARSDGAVGLAEPLSWLDPGAVESAIGAAALGHVDRIDYFLETESTNRSLLLGEAPPAGRLRVAIAEYQHGGRGRRGRSWIMPPAAGLALSVAWRFEQRPAALMALSLAVGAAARRALGEHRGVEVGLKWPNDLIVAGRKLGGILVELEPQDDGACLIVAGIGINVRLPDTCLRSVGSDRIGAIDLATIVPDATPERSWLAGRLIARLVELFTRFADFGFEPYRDEWQAAHVLDGASVELESASGRDFGRVCGIDCDGALLVADGDGRRRRVISGDVTVRVS